MVQIRGSLYIILWIFFGTFLFAQSVVAYVDRDEVVKGEMVELTIKAQGDDIVFPSITSIAGVKIEATSQEKTTHLAVINNKSEIINEEILRVSFYPEANSTIEPIDVLIGNKKHSTERIDITVVDFAKKSGDNKVSLELQLQKKEIYEKEAIVASLLFSHDRGLAITDIAYTPPKFEGFLSEEIGKQRQISKGRSAVTQVDYLLIAKEPGNFTIDPAKAQVSIQNSYSMGDKLGIFFDRPTKINIESNTKTVTINPLPVDVMLVGDFTIQAVVDKNSTKANEPVTLTLTLRGNGVIDTIQATPYQIKNVTTYEQDPTYNQRVKNGQLQATYEQKFIFMGGDDFTIPPLKIEAFSPSKQEKYTLITPSNKITITDKVIAPPVATQQVTTTSSSLHLFSAIAIFVAGLTTGMAILWLVAKVKTRKRGDTPTDKALMQLYPYVHADKEVEGIVRQLYAIKQGAKGISIDKKRLKEILQRYPYKIS